ncbi:hypothetical protein MMC07_007175 [Pseudocyphellaria aurata]|nr:hypothetical protein [Pseudocyphellaria aurata]
MRAFQLLALALLGSYTGTAALPVATHVQGPITVLRADTQRGECVPRSSKRWITASAQRIEGVGPVWATTVTLGDQHLSVLIDTGSADFWVTGTELPESQRGPHRLYDSSRSTSVEEQGQGAETETFRVDYAFPGASGHVVRERVAVGDMTPAPVPVGVATKIGPFLVDQPFDGVMGLAFKSMNTFRPNQSPTFMELIQDSLDLPVFTINFVAGDGKDQQQGGTLEFGRIDHSQYSGELVVVPVNNRTDGSWTVDSVWLSVNGVSVVQDMLVDTGGGHFMRVHPSIADAYWSQIQGSRRSDDKHGYWGFPCDAPLLDFKLKFLNGGGEVVIPGRFMNAGKLTDGAPDPLCTGALQGRHGRGSVAALFFEAFFVVFNQADPSISIAPHAKPSTQGER